MEIPHQYPNDHKQAVLTLALGAFAAAVLTVLTLMLILRTSACT